MGRLLRWMGFVAAALVAGAWAPPAEAADLCDNHYDLTQFEAEDQARWIAKTAPLDAFELARSLRIVVTPRPDQFGPEIRRSGERIEIAVPTGYRKLHCRMVVTTWAANEDESPISQAAFTADFKACIADGGKLPACIGGALDRQWPKVEALVETFPETKRDQIRSVVDSAFVGLLFHEFAHAKLGHLETAARSAAEKRRREFEADLYAAHFSSVIRGSSFGIPYNYLLLKDAYPASSHDSFTCRADDAFYIATKLGFASAAVVAFPNEPTQRMRDLLRQVAEDRDPFSANPWSRNCDPRDLPGLDGYRQDLRLLARFQNERADSLPAVTRLDEAMELIRTLRGLAMGSDYGRYLQARLVSHYIRYYSIHDEKGVLNPTLFEIITPGEHTKYYIARDFGRLEGVLGISLFHALPARKSPGEDNWALRRLLDVATYHNEDFSEAFGVRGLLALREGDCAAALAALRRAIATTTDPDMQRALPAIARRVEAEVAKGTCDLGSG